MKRISVLIVVVFTIVFGGCAPESAEQIDLEAERVAILEIWPQYSSALNSGDIDSWMSLWAEDGVQMPPDEPALSGRDQIRARNKAVWDQFSFDMIHQQRGSKCCWRLGICSGYLQRNFDSQRRQRDNSYCRKIHDHIPKAV